MKKQILILSIIVSLVFTACGSVEEAPVDNTDVIAEYTASLLLKYDRSYNEKLIDASYLEELQTEKEETKELVQEKQVNKENQSKQPQIDPTKNESSSFFHEFSKIIDNEDISIKFEKYGIYDNYPEEPENNYFALEKKTGKKFCVVEFSITNHSSKKKNVNLVKSEIIYQLEINSVTYNSLLTLLENDLQLLNADIQGNSSDTGHLVFEVPGDIEIKEGLLYATKDLLVSKIELQ